MLTLEFIPYTEIANLDSESRIKKLINVVKQEKIVLLEGRLKEEEETELIKKTMEAITDKFTGIELGVINPQEKDTSFYQTVQKVLARILLGKREGFTIIGPANIVKQIKKDPNKIQLFTKDSNKKKKSKMKK
ncbi:MAG: DUF2073 domain-containing protein [Nanoarchaeota archaeon]